MSEAENTGEEVLRTFVLEDPEGSARALREWGGEGTRISVWTPGQRSARLLDADGQAARARRGMGLRILLGGRVEGLSEYNVLGLPHASEIAVRVADGALWLDGAPRVALLAERASVPPGCVEAVAIGALPATLDEALEALSVFSADRLTDLERLRGIMALRYLHVEGADPLVDLSPLRGLTGLTTLRVSGCEGVTKLDPLSDLVGLTTLRLFGCDQLMDLGPLAALVSLTSLSLYRCLQLADLGPLRGLTAMKSLTLARCAAVEDLGPLRQLTDLAALKLWGSRRLTDLDPLRGLTRLASLDLRNCVQLADLGPLHDLTALTDLSLTHCERVTDLAPLRGLTRLSTLDMSGCERVTDLVPLRGLSDLTTLNISGCERVTDLAPVYGLTGLTSLDVSGCGRVADFGPLTGLTSLTSLDLSGCQRITELEALGGLGSLRRLACSHGTKLTSIAPLGRLTAIQEINLRGSSILTRISPLRSCRSLTTLDLSDSGNIRDLDTLSELPNLYELKWTETAAPHSVLAACAVLRGDAPFVKLNSNGWLSSVPLSKSPDTFGLRLVRAFALGGSAPWAADALTRLATALRDRARDDEDPLVITPHTWAAWADAALALEDDGLRAALDAALVDLRPREIAPVLTPVLTALADLGSANPAPRRSAPTWLVSYIHDVLAPFAAHEAHARQTAPAAAVFFAGFGLDEEVRAWLDRGTHPDAPLWRDRVVHALLVREARNGDLPGARRWLGRIATDEARDAARAALAEAFAARLPAEAAAELDAIGDDALRSRVARQLGTEPVLLAEPAGLYALVLALQDDAEALSATLSTLVEAHPGSALVAALARDLAPEPPAAPVAADPLPDVIAHPAWKEEVAGRKWEAFAGRLPPARVLLAEAVAARAVSEGLLDGDVAGELAGRVG